VKQLVSGIWTNEGPCSSEDSELDSSALVDVSVLPLVLVVGAPVASPAVLGDVVGAALVAGLSSSSSAPVVLDVSDPGCNGTDGPQLTIAIAAISNGECTNSK
jgi:hypothetical protein